MALCALIAAVIVSLLSWVVTRCNAHFAVLGSCAIFSSIVVGCGNSSVPLNLANKDYWINNCELSIFYMNDIKVPSH
jgi:hypothetical protein